MYYSSATSLTSAMLVSRVNNAKALIIQGDFVTTSYLEKTLAHTEQTATLVEAGSLLKTAYNHKVPFQIIILDEDTLKEGADTIALWFLYQPYLQHCHFIVITDDKNSLLLRMLKNETSVSTMQKSAILYDIQQENLLNLVAHSNRLESEYA